MDKQQNSIPHPKAFVTLLVVSSVGSIVVLLMNRAGDFSRDSCMAIALLVVCTGTYLAIMEKQQNSIAHPIRVKAAVTLLVASSVASIPVLLMNRAEDFSRDSCMAISLLVVCTGEHSRELPWNLTLRWIFSTLALFRLAWDAYFSYTKDPQRLFAPAVAMCELSIGTCLTIGCLLAHSNTLAQDDETLLYISENVQPILGVLLVMPPYNLCYKTIPFACICLFRQGSIGQRQTLKLNSNSV